MKKQLQLITAICFLTITTATCNAQSIILQRDTEQYYIKRSFDERQIPLRSDSLVLREQVNQKIQSRQLWRVLGKCEGMLIGPSVMAYVFAHDFHFNVAKSIGLTMPLPIIFWCNLPDLPSYNAGFKHTHKYVYQSMAY